jgi:hypothetical protein
MMQLQQSELNKQHEAVNETDNDEILIFLGNV